MQGSTPQTYTIAEVLKWADDRELELNPKFQRGPVWSPPARSYLIDSLLHGYPIPKLLFRTIVDRDSRRTIRDVVDGQQRLRTIMDFANDKLPLGAKAAEAFQGMKYSDLEPELQDAFLAYRLTCEQLINASDEDVLEIFVRINSYTVPVNGPELRNARFDNAFSSYVKDLIRQVPTAWEIGVLSNRDRVRMVDQSLIAEVVGFAQRGVTDGAEQDLDRLYQVNRNTSIQELPTNATIREAIETSARLLRVELSHEPLVARPHFLMLTAAVMYAMGALPAGRLDFQSLEISSPDNMLQDEAATVVALAELNTALESRVDDLPPALAEFANARATTQRMSSRTPRFRHFCRALTGRTIA